MDLKEFKKEFHGKRISGPDWGEGYLWIIPLHYSPDGKEFSGPTDDGGWMSYLISHPHWILKTETSLEKEEK